MVKISYDESCRVSFTFRSEGVSLLAGVLLIRFAIFADGIREHKL